MDGFDDFARQRAFRALTQKVGRSASRRVAVGPGPARWAVAVACGLVLVAAPLAVAGPSPGDSDQASAARTGDVIREGIRNPRRAAATRETQIISGVRGERYGTRQSNISTGARAGGAAIYGCRRPTRECTRHVNLRNGPAAHFATAGSVPFTIDDNAVGMVRGLNAERVGGLTAAQLRGQTGPQGPRGATGPQGPKGDKGDKGDPADAAWELDGNASTSAGANFLGTTDDEPLELRVNGERALRLEPLSDSPNVIGGHSVNEVEAGLHGVTIGGGGSAGSPNTVIGPVADPFAGNFATVGGGEGNTAQRFVATVGGGANNEASSQGATVGGGGSNTASGVGATVGGGALNTASGFHATVAGGGENTADGEVSFAAGRRAQADHDGAFVWADSTNEEIASTDEDQFIARAGGSFFLTDGGIDGSVLPEDQGFINTAAGAGGSTGTGGAFLSNPGVWTDASDRDSKTAFEEVDPASVLARVAELPLSSWEYKAERGVRHVGPVAQDFRGAFGLGPSDKHIAALDTSGVALAAIKGLKEENDELTERVEALEARLGGTAAAGFGGTGTPVLVGLGIAVLIGLGGLAAAVGLRHLPGHRPVTG